MAESTFGRIVAEVDRLRAQRDRLKAALEELMAVQNGPPLYTYAKAWEAAMAEAEAAVAEAEGGRSDG